MRVFAKPAASHHSQNGAYNEDICFYAELKLLYMFLLYLLTAASCVLCGSVLSSRVFTMLAHFAVIAWFFLTAKCTLVYGTHMHASMPLFAFLLFYRPEYI